MANLGFLGADGKVFHLSSSGTSTTGKRKKDEEELGVTQTVKAPTITSTPALVAVGNRQNQMLSPTNNKTQSTQPKTVEKQEQPTERIINADGYEQTNEKYGDYKYTDYLNKKDYKIYKKDGKAYYYDEQRNRYVDMDTPEMISPEEDKRQHQIAVKNGFVDKSNFEKGKQVDVSKVSDKINLKTSGLTQEEQDKYRKSLIRQEKERDKELSYVRRGGAGLVGFGGELQNIGKNVGDVAIDPLTRASSSYQYGKLGQDLSKAYYDRLMGKENDEEIRDLNRQMELYNMFNRDVIQSNNQLDQYFKNLPNEISGVTSGIKSAGPLGAAGAIGGGAIGFLTTKDPATSLAFAEQGAKLLGGAGYVKGQAENTFQLEAGAQYQALLEMGVPEEIARDEALKVGTVNALIESGESVLDLVTLGKSGVAIDKLKDGLLKKFGADALKGWGMSVATNVASEAGEELTQEGMSILSEKSAAKKSGIERDSSQDVNRLMQSAAAGGFGALISGGATRTLGTIGSTATKTGINAINNNINNRQQEVALSDATRPNTQETQNVAQKAKESPITEGTQIVDNTQEKGYNESVIKETPVTYKEIKNNTVQATIAPYYNTPLTKENYNEIKTKVDTSFRSTADSITKLLGGNVKDVSNNIGGFTFEEGQNAGQIVKELSYTFNLENVDRENARLMSSLMGDLGHEQQEAVITATYAPREDANALEYRVSFKNVDKVMDALEKAGINNYTIDESNNTLKLLEFDVEKPEETAKKVVDLYELLGDDVLNAEYSGVQSDYITKSDREGIYKTWLDANKRSPKNRELRALVEEAYQKVRTEETEGTSDSSFSNATKENPNKAETIKDNKITADTLKKMSDDLTKELNESFKLKKGEAYSRTPQTTVKSMSMYDAAPTITDFDRETVVHTIMSDEAAKIDAKARYEKNGSLEENAAFIRGLLQSDKRLTKNDKALAIYTMNEAYKQGNKEIGDGIVSDLTVLDVEAGQWAQASKLMKQMSPYGQLQTFIKMIKNSVDKGNPRFKNVKVTDEMINKVLDCYDKDGNWNNDQFAKNMEEFKYEVQEQMTPTLMDKFNSVRMLGMLGAPRTHIRNMLGNVGNMGLRTVKNFNDRVLESVLIRGNTEERTRTFKPATKEIKNYVDNVTKEELFGGNKYSDTKTELERNMKIFNEHHKGMARIVNPISWAMNKLSDKNSWALDMEDKLFSSFAYKRSLQEYLTAKGMQTVEDIEANPQVLADGKAFAMQQGLEATYRQDSELAAAISNYVKKSEGKNASKYTKFGGILVEANIPFKKTPINIAKTGIEFSPIGLTNGIYDALANVKSGKVEMSQAIDEISKGVTGLALLGVGALLAHNGMELTAADDDKDKKAKYDKSLGEMEYSVKIGNRFYDLSWMAPASMPLYTGIELYQTLVKEKQFDGNAVVNAISKTIDPLSSMSLLEGLSKSMKSYAKTPGEFISKFTMTSLENYITQYVPTILSQIANVKDDRKRTTTPSGKSSFTEFDKVWNNIKYRVPILRETLPEQTDAWGRVQMNDPIGLRIFNSFFNPANNSLDKKDATDRELERLYNDLGEDNYYSTRSLPKMDFDKFLTFNKEKYKLSNEELTKYKKTYGKTAKDGVDKLIKTEEYKNATDEEKGKMLTSLYDYANQKAKEQYGKEHDIPYDEYKLDQLYSLVDAYNIPIEKAVSNKTIQELKAEGGVSAKQRKINAVDEIDGLSKIQKDALKRKFTMFMGNPGYKYGEYALVDALNDSDVSEEAKNDIRKFLSLD